MLGLRLILLFRGPPYFTYSSPWDRPGNSRGQRYACGRFLRSEDEDGHWCIFSTMSCVFLRDVRGLAPFDCSDTAGISARREDGFELLSYLQMGKELNMLTRRKR